MFSFDPLAFLFLVALVAALLLSALGVALKLCGVLLVSWWWIALPVPALLILGLLAVGLMAILGK